MLALAAQMRIVNQHGLYNFDNIQLCHSTGLISSTVDGSWTDWGDWNLCSVTCAGGTQSRSRTCTNPPPRYGGRECNGESEDVQSCNEHPCPSKDILAYSYFLTRGCLSISSLNILRVVDLMKFLFVHGNAH